jgi:PQQ-like domain
VKEPHRRPSVAAQRVDRRGQMTRIGTRLVKNTARKRLLVRAFTVLAACAVTGGAHAAWNQYRGNAERTGRASWVGGMEHARVVWRRPVGHSISGQAEPPMYRSSPVVGEFGTVFVGAGRAAPLGSSGTIPHLFAFTSTGRLIWRSRLDGYAVYSAPAVGRDGRMMVIGQKFNDKALPVQRAFIVTEQGRILQADAIRRDGGGSPLVDDEGDFFYRDPWQLWKLSRTDHRTNFKPVLWAANLGDLTSGSDIYSALSDLYRGLSCFLTFPVSRCNEFDVSSSWEWGATPLPAPAGTGVCRDVAVSLWDRVYRVALQKRLLANLEWDALATPAIGRGGAVAYVSLKGQEMAAVSQSGQQLWRWGWGAQPVNIAIGHPGGVTSTPVVCQYVDASGHTVRVIDRTADRLYVREADGSLAAIDGETGRHLLWTARAKLVGEPVVLTSRTRELVVAASQTRLYGFRGEDGHQLWSLPLDGPARGSPAVADGQIYVATERSLYAIALQ